MPEPRVLIPGMICNRRLFAPQIAAFSCERPVMVVPSIGESAMAGLPRAFWRSPLAVIRGAGHLPTLEQPEPTNEVLQEWLRWQSPTIC